MAQSGLGSRRDMEALIAAGLVTVNGEVATTGQRVGPADRIQVRGRPVRLSFGEAGTRVLVYHKPPGEIVSRADPEGRPSVFDHLPPIKGGRWIAVGRLDFNTSGLLLFTNSGELAEKLMHPRNEVEREYAVRVNGQLSQEQRKQLLLSVQLEDGPARFDSIETGGGTGTNRWYKVMLHEGRNREVRRIFESLGLTVSRLMRVRYGPISLPPQLRQGKLRDLSPQEIAALEAEVAAKTS
jgi:23S rRNA pseudouridine2605 synthase